MEKRIIRRPILIAAAGIAGVLTLLAGYVESQAAAKYEFEVASVKPQALALSDDQLEVSAPTSSGAPVMAKPHRPAKPPRRHVEPNIPTHRDIESLTLLAGAAQERFALGLRVRVMPMATK